MHYAVVRIAGKQYLVQPGLELLIDQPGLSEGSELSLDEVLLVVNQEQDKVCLGKALLKGAVVKAEVLGAKRSKKVVGLKYKRGGHRVKFGHRQNYTRIRIKDIQYAQAD